MKYIIRMNNFFVAEIFDSSLRIFNNFQTIIYYRSPYYHSFSVKSTLWYYSLHYKISNAIVKYRAVWYRMHFMPFFKIMPLLKSSLSSCANLVGIFSHIYCFLDLFQGTINCVSRLYVWLPSNLMERIGSPMLYVII